MIVFVCMICGMLKFLYLNDVEVESSCWKFVDEIILCNLY